VARSENETVTAVIGQFGPALSPSVERVLMKDCSIDVLSSGLTTSALDEAVREQQPHIVVLDEMIEYGVLARLKARHPSTAVVVVASKPSLLAGTMLLAVGATCVAESAPAPDLLAAVHHATPTASIFVREDGHWTERHSGSDSRLLTRRETEVFEQLSKGKSYAEAALKLRIGYETVRTHAGRICKKLGKKSRLELVGMSLPSEGRQTI